ncbi:hypothetical protein C7Y47_19165 [Lysinibacillus sphaericus]|uniref:2-keto-3-deoxygluconate kinase n=1 Tax=Lysinibacillus sphaericus TaxID=1421 RepID=A0A544UA38_LYSSH|nr:hypothetical protein [Lysinibacillus sp. SDF0037]TQR29011.1 hypothetical protein C7Y47_19165 [Lysinibacillus sp. SDF0037]
MRSEKMKEFREEGHHRGGRYRGRDGSHQRGPKTFRRGRAIAFLEMMKLKRTTIKQQLEQPEFQSIQPILVGELKAIDMVINEFIQLFEIHESETMAPSDSEEDNEKSLKNDEEGNNLNENN